MHHYFEDPCQPNFVQLLVLVLEACQFLRHGSHREWMEIEIKKFKACQAKMWAKIRQEREALEIQKDKSIDSGKKENSVIK